MKPKIAITLLGLAITQVNADTTPAPQPFNNPNQAPKVQSNIQTEAWLGVSLAPVPIALKAQLNTLIDKNQGVLITQLNQNSPAIKAGLKRFDIVLSLDDQTLYSAHQLQSLIKSKKPQTEVNLKVIQQGQIKSIKVLLGEKKINGFYPPRWQTNPFFQPRMQAPITQNQTNLAWDSFESVQVNTLADGRYHAEVAYKNARGEQQKFTFEGKRDEVVKQIQSHKTLPKEKKQALLNALNMRPEHLLNQPFFNQDPFMNGNPFNDPFFRQFNQGFPMMRSPFFNPYNRNPL